MNHNFKNETKFETIKGTDKIKAIIECFNAMTNQEVVKEYKEKLETYATYLRQDTCKKFRNSFNRLVVKTKEGSVSF